MAAERESDRAEVLEFPAQELAATGDEPPAGPFDLAIFTSPAAVEFGRERLRGNLPARLAPRWLLFCRCFNR